MERNSWGKGWNEGSKKANKCPCQTAGSALAWRCPLGQGQNGGEGVGGGGGGPPRWTLEAAACEPRLELPRGIRGGWNVPARTARCVCGDGLCILGQLQVCQKAGKRSTLQNLRQTFPRPHGVTADGNRLNADSTEEKQSPTAFLLDRGFLPEQGWLPLL